MRPVIRRLTAPAVVLLAILAVSGCQSTGTQIAASAAPSAGGSSPGASCTDAFEEAVAVGTGDEGVAFNALRPVFTACTTVEEWVAEFERHHGLGYLGTAREVLGHLCENEEVAGEPLCAAARAQ